MQFIMYWELNEDMPSDERLAIDGQLMETGLFPPEGAKVTGWWGTPDNWGILMIEADTAEAAFDSLNVWRNAAAGIFTFTKTAPAMKIEDSVAHGAELMQKMAAALGSD